MFEFVCQVHYATGANLTVVEAIILAVLGLTGVLVRKKVGWAATAYSIFLIFYITLLRREPGYQESILLRPQLYLNLGNWVGNLLNLLLYIPFGWAVERWKKNSKVVIWSALGLSVFCEATQYLTAKGQADINDVLFNTVGAVAGACLAGWMTR